jgi:hypothetical protein
MFAQVRQSVVSSVNSWPIQSRGSRIKMNGNALSQSVHSNSNGWRKTGARDAPGGTYAAVTGAIRVSGGPVGRIRVSIGPVGKTQKNNSVYCLYKLYTAVTPKQHCRHGGSCTFPVHTKIATTSMAIFSFVASGLQETKLSISCTHARCGNDANVSVRQKFRISRLQ